MLSEFAVVQTAPGNIGRDVKVGEFCIIRPDVIIGDGSVIHPNVVLNSGVKIGSGVEIFPGAIIGKEPKGAGATARIPVFEPIIEIGSDCSIGPNAVIYYDVRIGNNTLVGDGASIREKCVIGSYCLISRYVTINYNTKVGNNSKIMDLTHITGNCEVGEGVFISTMVATVNDNAIGREGYDESKIKGPKIGDHSMIGAGAVLLPSISIGEFSVVGANSVVTKDVMPHHLVMGVPARFIKSLN